MHDYSRIFCRTVISHVFLIIFVADDSDVNVIMLYDGEWETSEKGRWMFSSTCCKGLIFPKNVSYQSLVDQIYSEMDVEKEKYKLVLEVVYHYNENILP